MKKTSWEGVNKWYKGLVGETGHYYHEHVIFPHLLQLLSLSGKDRLLDIACGNGVLARKIPGDVKYLGLDISPSLIKEAGKNKNHEFKVADVTKAFPTSEMFSHATVILALQNIEHPEKVLLNVAKHLEKNGKLIIVLNHPCFRIPRQSSWEIDEAKKIQFRRIDRYMTTMQIPIQMSPGKGKKSVTTLSFHHPISSYANWLKQAGFVIENIEEWCSDKSSTGGAAKMENRAREEIPLFMAIVARKDFVV